MQLAATDALELSQRVSRNDAIRGAANPETRCFIVEPEGVAVLSGAPVRNPAHRIQGGGYAMPYLEMIRPEHVDGYVQVSDCAAISAARGMRERPLRQLHAHSCMGTAACAQTA